MNRISGNTFSSDQTFVVISAVSVMTAIVVGFWLLGSPSQQRLLSLDRQRVDDLSSIAYELQAQFSGSGADPATPLPEQLPGSLTNRGIALDPVNAEPYAYRRLSDTTYELCATFATESINLDEAAPAFNNDYWPHPEGRHCFEVDNKTAKPKL
ncbi:MAG: hypothetical protein HC800_21640 [Phormidesmis sp. RL_2_1]|nr:hypothetical protein [Phormidesmis sp. RL_2_1]